MSRAPARARPNDINETHVTSILLSPKQLQAFLDNKNMLEFTEMLAARLSMQWLSQNHNAVTTIEKH